MVFREYLIIFHVGEGEKMKIMMESRELMLFFFFFSIFNNKN